MADHWMDYDKQSEGDPASQLTKEHQEASSDQVV